MCQFCCILFLNLLSSLRIKTFTLCRTLLFSILFSVLSTHSLTFPTLHLTLWMFPVSASKVYKNKLSLSCHWAKWIYIIHLLLSLYLAKVFLRVHHWQVVKLPSKLLCSVEKMAFMLLIEVFLSGPFSGWTVDSFPCWSAERQPTKHQEELSC